MGHEAFVIDLRVPKLLNLDINHTYTIVVHVFSDSLDCPGYRLIMYL